MRYTLSYLSSVIHSYISYFHITVFIILYNTYVHILASFIHIFLPFMHSYPVISIHIISVFYHVCIYSFTFSYMSIICVHVYHLHHLFLHHLFISFYHLCIHILSYLFILFRYSIMYASIHSHFHICLSFVYMFIMFFLYYLFLLLFHIRQNSKSARQRTCRGSEVRYTLHIIYKLIRYIQCYSKRKNRTKLQNWQYVNNAYTTA